ncbi:DinB family protein [Micromonospora rubida]
MDDLTEERFLDRWRPVRGRTFELLGWLTDRELEQCPASRVGHLWRQFRHLGRIECNYASALTSKEIKFGAPEITADGSSKADLLAYLARVDADVLVPAVRAANRTDTVTWPGEDPLPLAAHLERLVQHEVLHQGQLIVAVSLLDFEFPPGWRMAWGLPG